MGLGTSVDNAAAAALMLGIAKECSACLNVDMAARLKQLPYASARTRGSMSKAPSALLPTPSAVHSSLFIFKQNCVSQSNRL